MKGYLEKYFLMSRYRGWFEYPHDVAGVALATFFLYEKKEVPGFVVKPAVTLVIDLSQSLELIWDKFRKKFIREQLERNVRRGVTVKRSNNFDLFEPIYNDFQEKTKIALEPFGALKNGGILFIAWYEGLPVAGGVFHGDGIHFRAWVLASKRVQHDNGRMRDIIGGANRILIWEAINYAKHNKYKIFDLGGINPYPSNTQERAVVEFKEGFGGERFTAFYYEKFQLRIIGWLLGSPWLRMGYRWMKNIFSV